MFDFHFVLILLLTIFQTRCETTEGVIDFIKNTDRPKVLPLDTETVTEQNKQVLQTKEDKENLTNNNNAKNTVKEENNSIPKAEDKGFKKRANKDNLEKIDAFNFNNISQLLSAYTTNSSVPATIINVKSGNGNTAIVIQIPVVNNNRIDFVNNNMSDANNNNKNKDRGEDNKKIKTTAVIASEENNVKNKINLINDIEIARKIREKLKNSLDVVLVRTTPKPKKLLFMDILKCAVVAC